VHDDVQLLVPGAPPPVVQERPVEPRTHGRPSSGMVSQSSSRPLHVSPEAQQGPSVQLVVQSAVPATPLGVVQAMPVAPRTQAKPSSRSVSQSSSVPLHASAGGVHEEGAGTVHVVVHVPVPVDPQVVVHEVDAPRTQAKPSSRTVSQSSSAPLHVSAGGVHEEGAGSVQVVEHVPVPVDPHVVVQETAVERMQAKPSSRSVSQSSSTPLHVSAGTVHEEGAGSVQVVEQTPVPVEPQVVVHDVGMPIAQANPLSGPATQSSSSPLQISVGGVQEGAEGREHDVEHVPDPVVPQIVVQVTGVPCTQG